MSLYRIQLDGNKSYLTRMYMGEMLITDIHPKDDKPLKDAKDAIDKGIRNRRRDAMLGVGLNFQPKPRFTIREQSGYFVKQFKQKKLSVLNKAKKPKNGQQYVGVEIEFISNHSQNEIKDFFILAGLSEYVNLTTDGSVRGDSNGDNCDGSCRDNCECNSCNGDCDDDCDGDHDFDCNCACDCSGSGHELRVIATQKQIKDVIKRVSKVLVDKCNATVNKTCGLHVHLDMRKRDVQKSFHNLVNMQPLLYSMVPLSRRENSYSRPTSTTDFQRLERSGDRYLGVNPCSFRRHKTLEVRLHSGTVCATKINNWIELLLSIVEHKSYIGEIKTLDDVAKGLQLRDQLVKYIVERSKKFSNKYTFDAQNVLQAA